MIRDFSLRLRDVFRSRPPSRAGRDPLRDRRRRRQSRHRLALEFLEQRALLSVTVMTDQMDYPPGSTAQISGSGWQPGDNIQLQVTHTDGNQDVSPADDPWTVVAADDGTISSSWYVDPDSSTGDSLELTATDLTTGDVATQLFTDASGTKVSSITTTVASGTYGSGSMLDFTVNFVTSNGSSSATENVITTGGTPSIPLNSGGAAIYKSGSGTSALVFEYAVGASDSATRLDYTGSSIVLNGGTIRNGTGSSNNAGLTLPSVASGNDGIYNANITISSSTVSSANAGSAAGPTSSPEGTAFALYVTGTGFRSSSSIVFNGSTLTPTTYVSSTSIYATVPASLVADELSGATVSVSTGGSTTFTITDADSVTATTGPNITATEGTAVTPSTLATFTDTYANQVASEFAVTSINWGDGTVQTSFSPAPTINIDNSTGIVSVGGVSHTYADEGRLTTVKTAAVLPVSGTYTISVANNGTNSFPSSGTLTIYTPSGGFQTVSYTGTTTGTSASFTGCSGGTGALSVGSPITHAFGSVTVTLGPADSGDTWTAATATGSVSVQNAGTVVLTANPSSSFTEGSVGTLTASFTDTFGAAASDFVATIDWGDGSPVSTCAVSGSGGSYTITSPGHIFPLYGPQNYTITLYDGNGLQLASGGNTITVKDATSFASYLTNAAIATASNGVSLPASTIYTQFNTLNFPTSGTINITTATGVTTNVSYTGLINSYNPSTFTYTYGFSGCTGGTGVLAAGDTVTVGVNATEGSSTPSMTVLKFTDPGTVIVQVAPASNGVSLPTGTISVTQYTNTIIFPSSGTLTIALPGGGTTTVWYTGYNANTTATFTGCTGGSGTLATGSAVTFGGGSTTGYASVFSGTTINWGDSNPSPGTVTWVGYNQYTVVGSHTYAEEGSYATLATVVDSGGGTLTQGSTQASTTVLVSDPAVVASGVSAITAAAGNSVALATFTDPGGAEANDGTHYAATVNWGGSLGSTAGIISFAAGTFTVSGTIPSGAGGSYSPVVTINHESTTPQTVTDSLTVPIVTDFRVLFGTKSYSLIGSNRYDLPWQITGIQVSFNTTVTGDINSLTGTGITVTAGSFSGSGTSTLTWGIAALTQGTFSASIATSGVDAVLAGGVSIASANTSENFNVLYGDFNGDGVVTSADVVGITNAISGSYNIFADMNGDGVVNSADATIARSRNGKHL